MRFFDHFVVRQEERERAMVYWGGIVVSTGETKLERRQKGEVQSRKLSLLVHIEKQKMSGMQKRNSWTVLISAFNEPRRWPRSP